jgi:hypothetical protein
MYKYQEMSEAYKKMGSNFMTPRVRSYKINEKKGMLVELSSGTGIDGKNIFGVSVFDFDGEYYSKNDRGQLFDNLRDAVRYYGDFFDNN